jgi:hypothetical protein
VERQSDRSLAGCRLGDENAQTTVFEGFSEKHENAAASFHQLGGVAGAY